MGTRRYQGMHAFTLSALVVIAVEMAAGYLFMTRTQLGRMLALCLHDPAYHVLSSKEFEFVADFMGMRYMGSSRELVDRRIFIDGSWEKPVLFFMRDVLRAQQDPESVFFDVGAYTGPYSLYLSRFVRRIHAFEPFPPTAERFRRNMELNRITNVSLHEIGLGSENGEIPFYAETDQNAGASSFAPDSRAARRAAPISLPLRRGDDLPAEVTARLDLLKIDVEGFEKNVLGGMTETLRRTRPVIVFEMSAGLHESFKDRDDVLAVLPKDYELRQLIAADNEQSGRYRLVQLGKHPANQSYVGACPAERAAALPQSSEAAAEEPRR